MDINILTHKVIGCAYKVHNTLGFGFLTATGVDNGLLINFGTTVQIKRKFREYRN